MHQKFAAKRIFRHSIMRHNSANIDLKVYRVIAILVLENFTEFIIKNIQKYLNITWHGNGIMIK